MTTRAVEPTSVDAAVRALVDALRAEFAEQHPPAPAGLDPLVSMAEAARILGIHRTALYPLIESGRLISLRVGRRRMLTASSLRALTGQGDR